MTGGVEVHQLYTPFPSIARLSRDIVITEKIDGTNAQIHVTEDLNVRAGSRTRWITPEDDNFGFARWVAENAGTLALLGPGTHFGEWWGQGIQRKYGLTEKRFSLFNTGRWTSECNDLTIPPNFNTRCREVPICHVVPVLWSGAFSTVMADEALQTLAEIGSVAAPGFMKPEGVVIYHEAARVLFKKTLDGDGHKGAKSK